MGVLLASYRRWTRPYANITRTLRLGEEECAELRLIQLLLHLDIIFDHLYSPVRLYNPVENAY